MQRKSQPGGRIRSLERNRIQHRMHSPKVRFGPINAAAPSALGKSIVTGENVRRYSSRHEFSRSRGQRSVASRTSRQRNLPRIETEASDCLAQLISDELLSTKKTSEAVRRRLSRVTRIRFSARAILRRSAPVSDASAITSAPSSRSQRANRISIRSTARRGVSSIAIACIIAPFHEVSGEKDV